MGYSIAEVCANMGAEVILVSGPVSISLNHKNIRIIPVNTAEEMFAASMEHFKSTDIAILSAAVADFSPEFTLKSKIKREKEDMVLNLKPTRDIAKELGKIKKDSQLLIGFALETNNEIDNAKSKLKRKNLDLIVLNSLKDEGAGFGTDTNKITIIDKNNNIDNFELKSKKEVAIDIVNKIITLV